jgi:hypothetical protein
MSAPLTVAVLSEGALRAYHQANGSGLAQVAQLAVGTEVEPEVIASIMADLGATLGWGVIDAPAPRAAVGRAAGALPAAAPAPAKVVATVKPKPKPKRRPPEAVDAERQAVLDAIERQPGVMRTDLAAQLGIDLPRIKRRTDELLARGAIDATPLPGVRERGPGGGHGLFVVPLAEVAP